MKFKNPIIPGYSPDPSICRVGDDFYLVNSTFEFFPGVPIYHSTNLVNWELIGHALTRESQLYLQGCRNSGGIYAPTIRYHEGTFFMITTNVTHKGNFVVHTDDVRRGWSQPHWIDQGGIDPSLFWDDDGTCYYCSTGFVDGVRGLVGFVIDPYTGEILSEKRILSTGCGGQCAEGPHLYKKDGWYYLMNAEGGTEYGHHEVVSRARSVWGPYEACPYNPILCHSQRKRHEIQATGHADLVEDANGNWWAVFLGIRNFSHALLHNLGRETFLAPVEWKDGWPVIGKGGHVELEEEGMLPGEPVREQNFSMHLDFAQPISSYNVMFTRNPRMENYRQDCENRVLTLSGTDVTINEPGVSPTIISFRQPDFETQVTAKVSLSGFSAARAGISAYYNNDYHYDIFVSKCDSEMFVGFYKHIHDMGVTLAKVPVPEGTEAVELQIRTDREKYAFFCRMWDGTEEIAEEIPEAATKTGDVDEIEKERHKEGGKWEEKIPAGRTWQCIGSGLNAGLCTEGTYTMTFTGTLFALFAENGKAAFLDGVRLDCEK